MGCARCKKLGIVCFLDRWNSDARVPIIGHYPMPVVDMSGYERKSVKTIIKSE